MTSPTTIRTEWNMICPSCKEDDSLDIAATVMVRLCQNGTDADESIDGGHTWSDESSARCSACGWEGTVKETQDACLANPEKVRDRPAFPHLEVEAALCAWEHLLDQSVSAPYRPYFQNLGYAAMRACAIQAGVIANTVYQFMKDEGYEFQAAYDWEFVPTVLSRLDWKALTEDNQFNGQPYRPDIETLFDAVLEAQPEDFYKRDPEAEWTDAARRECIRQWGYAELIDDCPEYTGAARKAGQDPAEFVRALGEKYDLDPDLRPMGRSQRLPKTR